MNMINTKFLLIKEEEKKQDVIEKFNFKTKKQFFNLLDDYQRPYYAKYTLRRINNLLKDYNIKFCYSCETIKPINLNYFDSNGFKTSKNKKIQLYRSSCKNCRIHENRRNYDKKLKKNKKNRHFYKFNNIFVSADKITKEHIEKHKLLINL